MVLSQEALSGRRAEMVMANGGWTAAHLRNLWGGRVAIVFITVLLAVLTLTNMHTIGVGLSPTEVVPDDSYVIDYFDRYEKSWKGTITMPLSIIHVFLV